MEETWQHRGWLVVDNEFNREHYDTIVGLIFDVPPSYAQVIATDRPSDYYSKDDYDHSRN